MRGEDMLLLIEEIAQRLHEELYTKAGQRRFGKHSWRSTGAVHLSGIGLDTIKVQLIGRWMCAVVLRYVRDAPIADIARDYKTAARAKNAEAEMKKSSALNNQLRDDLDSWMLKYKTEVTRLEELIAAVERTCAPRQYVVNRRTRKIHKILTSVSDAGSAAIAYCGWQYGLAPISCHASLPSGAKKDYCAACLADVRASIK